MKAGERVGRFEVESLLGRGGGGEVWRARDPAIGRPVALKFLRDDRDLERFTREARTAARVPHPNIAAVYEFGEHDGRPFIAMQFVDGRTLSPALPRMEGVMAVRDAARAMGHAHGLGVVHRDLKPSNLMLDASGRLFVMDFGLARSVPDPGGLTQSGMMLGTPAYMSPEQARGERADARSDVWSLGATLYELVTGRLPFDGGDVLSIAMKIVGDDPPDPACEPPLRSVILRCLDKDPDGRYPTGAELADDLDRFLRGEAVHAAPEGSARRLVRRLLRRRSVLLAGAAGALVAAVLAAILARAISRGEKRALAAEEEVAVQLRTTADACLQAALDLRRAGDLARMGEQGRNVADACARVREARPGSAEPHFVLGRMRRAEMRDADALAEQDEALRKDPSHAGARYERVLLRFARYRRRILELGSAWWARAGREAWLAGGGRPAAPIGARPADAVLASGDARARSMRDELAADLDALDRAMLLPGERACTAAVRAWLAGDLDTASDRFDAAARASPFLEEAFEWRAELELDRHRYADAERLRTEGMARDRGYIGHVEGRGAVRHEWGNADRARGLDPGPRYAQAAADYEEAARRDPTRLSPLLALARLRLESANATPGPEAAPVYRQAIAACDRAVALDARGPEPFLRRASARLNLAAHVHAEEETLYRDAFADLEDALARTGDREEILAARGSAHMNRGVAARRRGGDPRPDFESALRDLNASLELHGGDPPTWRDRGLVRLNWGEYESSRGRDPTEHIDAAIRDFEAALRLNPRYAPALLSRAGALGNLATWRSRAGLDGEPAFDQSRRDCDAVISLLPRWDEPWLARGDAHYNHAHARRLSGADPVPLFERAVKDYDEALARRPDRAQTLRCRATAWSSVGLAALDAGRDPVPAFEAADRDLRRAIELEPGDASGYVDRGGLRVNWAGHVRRKGADPEPLLRGALEDLDRAVELNPGDATAREFRGNAHCSLAFARLKVGRAAPSFRAAVADYEEAIRLDPLVRPKVAASLDYARRYLREHPEK